MAAGKRGAEKQLTDRNWDRDDDDEEGSENSEGGFAAAPPAQLATRKIRGMPSRKTASPSPGPAAPAPPAPKPSPFAAFTGFGPASAVGAPKSNPFANIASPAPTAPPPSNPFASLQPSTGMSGFTFPPSSGTIGSAPQPMSFGPMTGSSPSPSPPPTFTPTFSAPVPSTTTKGTQQPALKYYTHLRALNISFVEAVTSQMEQDPFVDFLAGDEKLVKKYREERGKIEKEYKESQETKEESNGLGMDIDMAGKEKRPSLPTPTFTFTPSPNLPPVKVTPPTLPTPTISFTPPAASPSPAPIKAAAAPAPMDPIKSPSDPKPTGFVLPKAPAAFTSWGDHSVKVPEASSSTPPAGAFVLKKEETKGVEKSAFKFPTPPAAPTPPTSTTTTTAPASASLPPPQAIKIANAPAAPSPLRYGESVSPPSSSPVSTLPPAASKEKFKFGEAFSGIINDKKEEPKEEKKKAPNFSGFSFGSSSGATKEEVPSPKTTTFGSSTPTFSFGTPASKTTEQVSTPFAFPTPPATTEASSTAAPFSFGSGIPIPPPKTTPSSPPITTTFGFGASGSPPSFGFGAALAKKEPTVVGSKSPGFTFGAGPATTTPNGEAKKTTTGFSFGASTTTTPTGTTTAAFSFGTPSTGPTFGSGAASTGFSFGAGAAPASSGFSFGAAPASAIPSATLTEIGDADPSSKEGSVEPTADPSDSTPSTNPFAGTGEGEEGEEVVHEDRGKVWKADSTGEMKELGVGKIQIKEKDGVKRLLARNEVTGGVMINFRLVSSLSFKLEKTFLTFMGFDGIEPRMFRLRIKTKEQVEALKKALEEAAGISK